MKQKNKIIWLVIAVLLVSFVLFNIFQSAPQYKTLDENEQKLLQLIAADVTKGKETDLEKITSLVIFVREQISPSCPDNYSGKNPNYSHVPLDILERKWGQCFDLTYLLEILAQSMNYETKHVALIAGDKSHAVSEIKIGSKWVFFDPTAARYYTDKTGALLSAKEILDKTAEELKEIQLVSGYEHHATPKKFKHIAYGLFNFHGKQFSPKISYPDMIFSQLHYNLINTKFPFTYKNLYYIAIIILFCAGVFLIIKNVWYKRV